MAKKTDNGHLAPKLDLRRYFLKKYHADGAARVMDCCMGSGKLWHHLRREFVVESYWGIDLKPKHGRLKVDSARILSQPGWTENVIDVDTYGSPWKHWLALVGVVDHPVTVFLTIGRGGPNMIQLSKEEFGAIGLTLPTVQKIKCGLTHRLVDLAIKHCLAVPLARGGRIVEAIEAVATGNARYLGVRLEPPKPATS